jgi:hypothetical protein
LRATVAKTEIGICTDSQGNPTAFQVFDRVVKIVNATQDNSGGKSCGLFQLLW